jgi:hypothetical protein
LTTDVTPTATDRTTLFGVLGIVLFAFPVVSIPLAIASAVQATRNDRRKTLPIIGLALGVLGLIGVIAINLSLSS